MPKPSPFFSKMTAISDFERDLIRETTKRWLLDMATVALGRMGYGEKRLARFRDTFDTVMDDYSKLWASVGKDDEDLWEAKNKLDGELREHCGTLFVPHKERYAALYRAWDNLERAKKKGR